MNEAVRIGVDYRLQPFQQLRIIIQRLRHHRLLHQDQLFLRDIKCAQRLDVGRGSDDDLRIEVLQHALEALRRRFDVKVGITVAAVEYAEVRNNGLRALGKKYGYRPSEGGSLFQDQ